MTAMSGIVGDTRRTGMGMDVPADTRIYAAVSAGAPVLSEAIFAAT